jgi:hypothetical protein
MGRRLRMSAELSDWLAGLCGSDPQAAGEAGARLVAVLDADDVTALGFVTDLSAAGPDEPGDLVAAIGQADSHLWSGLGVICALVAQAADDRRATRLRHGPSSGTAEVPWTAAEAEDLVQREHDLAARLERGTGAVKSWQGRARLARARYKAASATVRIAEVTGHDPAEAAQSLAAAVRELTGLLAEASALRQSLVAGPGDSSGHPVPGAGDAPTGPSADASAGPADAPGVAAAGLLEVASGTAGSVMRLLCAVEPPGSLSLLAAITGRDAILEHREAAITLASELLAEIRADGWPPEIGQQEYADSAAFARQFFAGSATALWSRAGELALASTLAGLRQRRDLSLADLAASCGLSEGELRKLETGELGAARLGDIAAYVRGAGGTIEVTARFPDGRHPLI